MCPTDSPDDPCPLSAVSRNAGKQFRRWSVVFGVCVVAAIAFVQFHPIKADIVTAFVTVDGGQRSYRVVVPHTLAKPASVVLAFHGTGDSVEGMAAYSRLDQLAADSGFLLVYPAARRGMWEAVDIEVSGVERNKDVLFVDAILQQLRSDYNIAESRVYALGMSNGASFAQLLAHARPATVAVVVAHSGARPAGLRASERPFPILMIVGSEDRAADLMRSDTKRYQAGGHEAKLVSVGGLGHTWSAAHNADLWAFLSRQELGSARSD